MTILMYVFYLQIFYGCNGHKAVDSQGIHNVIWNTYVIVSHVSVYYKTSFNAETNWTTV